MDRRRAEDARIILWDGRSWERHCRRALFTIDDNTHFPRERHTNSSGTLAGSRCARTFLPSIWDCMTKKFDMDTLSIKICSSLYRIETWSNKQGCIIIEWWTQEPYYEIEKVGERCCWRAIFTIDGNTPFPRGWHTDSSSALVGRYART